MILNTNLQWTVYEDGHRITHLHTQTIMCGSDEVVSSGFNKEENSGKNVEWVWSFIHVPQGPHNV
jgi:hypothetical protein